MRRRAGLGAIQKQKLEQEKYKDKSNEIQENQFEQMTRQLEFFKTNLEEFASKHKSEIKKNPEFRRQFQEMCSSIGVDPLSSGKGFWSILGIGDFYYELAVQIIEVCLATNNKNGGLISLEELRTRLINARGKRKEHQEISKDDLLRAAQKLKIFGSGFNVIPYGRGKYMVQSLPGELSMDHSAILTQTSSLNSSFVSVSILRKQLNWEPERCKNALENLVNQGLAWVDLQNTCEKLYYFPSLFNECVNAESA
ncbi:vacuolar-sorting protein SNF8 isoform X2 [Anthonomus grandis grandis]|uniref:vacuolar-sorting protein SNF8 isoform X2 n=1 Tax=Anthonomus grandis grandis TaxID=2921223 RepID=UPI0021662B80|nr:vacuolar-sorting protein SNF8 isoform X2 [Anthonomus grandis grandis]XP_050299168.1 vacuolar-sorting protein SNF8 isoform X2 [Anthonomus grandis grandis]